MSNKVILRLGLFGGGVVGGGVCELLHSHSARLASMGVSVEVAKICVRDINKPRDFFVGKETTIVTNYDDILEDSSINCVVELIGGVTNAKDIVFKAIKAGKHVVTANKALIATHLTELTALLAINPNVSFNFEASVCGGIPIIRSLQTDFLGDNIMKVMGIMNGTTNYMLSKMEDEGVDYGPILKEAQDLGYAEASPEADVEGYDVQAKIALLTKLCFGKTVDPASIPTAGISAITAVDFEYAKLLKSTIKLLGTSVLSGGKLAVYVSPVIVPLSSPLASAKGPGNMVVVNSVNMPESTFAGPGAGRWPTANSVLNDIVRIAQGLTVAPFPLQSDVPVDNDYTAKFYVRVTCSDGLGIIRHIGDAAESSGVSINSILQNPITNPEVVDFVVTTESCRLSEVQSFVYKVKSMSFSLRPPLLMSML